MGSKLKIESSQAARQAVFDCLDAESGQTVEQIMKKTGESKTTVMDTIGVLTLNRLAESRQCTEPAVRTRMIMLFYKHPWAIENGIVDVADGCPAHCRKLKLPPGIATQFARHPLLMDVPAEVIERGYRAIQTYLESTTSC